MNAIPVLRVADAEAALSWWARLGFAEEFRHQFEPGFPWYVGVRRGETRVHLSEHSGDAAGPGLAYLWVADVDAVAAEFATAVEDNPWARECEVTDPDGNRVRVASPPAVPGHRSRIGVLLVDHPEETHAGARDFWAAVQGVEAVPEPDDDTYAHIGQAGTLNVETQCIGSGTTARVHLDIETDDVAAEVARVVTLGADVLEEREGYTILTDPGGLVFCVVPVQTGDRFAVSASVRGRPDSTHA